MQGEESSDLWDRYLISERRTFILLSIHGQARLPACGCLRGCQPVVTDRAWAGAVAVFKVVLICERQIFVF